MSKKVAVITDATSPGFFYPKWHEYYGGAFGAAQLFVVTYEGMRSAFRDRDIGGLWELPHRYSDSLRARVISGLVRVLLETHDVVVRCDVDEFLVPDPTRYKDLSDYVERLELPYVTARGTDVIEERADPPLEDGRPILNVQRRRAIRQSSLNKTAVTRVPLTWCEGFHGCDAAPTIDDLYLFHMKFADIKRRVSWFSHMHDQVTEGGSEKTYFATDTDFMLSHQSWLLDLPEVDGWSALVGLGFDERFLKKVTRNPDNECQTGPFADGGATFLIPTEFAGLV